MLKVYQFFESDLKISSFEDNQFLIEFIAFFKKMFIFHENVFFMKKIILNSYK